MATGVGRQSKTSYSSYSYKYAWLRKEDFLHSVSDKLLPWSNLEKINDVKNIYCFKECWSNEWSTQKKSSDTKYLLNIVSDNGPWMALAQWFELGQELCRDW